MGDAPQGARAVPAAALIQASKPRALLQPRYSRSPRDTLEPVWEHRYGGIDAEGPGG
jgi:hypothetical protein